MGCGYRNGDDVYQHSHQATPTEIRNYDGCISDFCTSRNHGIFRLLYVFADDIIDGGDLRSITIIRREFMPHKVSDFRFLILFAVVATARTFAADAPVKPNDMLAICGDSITEQKMYSAYIEEYILACQPTTGIRSMQFGWGGDTTWIPCQQAR